jgi:hypothetical protein
MPPPPALHDKRPRLSWPFEDQQGRERKRQKLIKYNKKNYKATGRSYKILLCSTTRVTDKSESWPFHLEETKVSTVLDVVAALDQPEFLRTLAKRKKKKKPLSQPPPCCCLISLLLLAYDVGKNASELDTFVFPLLFSVFFFPVSSLLLCCSSLEVLAR